MIPSPWKMTECQKKPEEAIKIEEEPRKGRKKKEKRTLIEISQDG
jgi:hypothetical protein